MYQIKSDNELNSIIGNAINIAVQETIDKALVEFKETINEVVYNVNTPLVYQRTYEFLDSWESEVKKTIGGAEGTIGQNLATMLFNPQLYQHGSEDTGDLRDELASILFEGTDTSIFGDGWWSEPRDAWFVFITEITKNGKIFQWFREAMKSQGLSLTKI